MIINPGQSYDVRDLQITESNGEVVVKGPITIASGITGEVVGTPIDAAGVVHIIIVTPTPPG